MAVAMEAIALASTLWLLLVVGFFAGVMYGYLDNGILFVLW